MPVRDVHLISPLTHTKPGLCHRTPHDDHDDDDNDDDQGIGLSCRYRTPTTRNSPPRRECTSRRACLCTPPGIGHELVRAAHSAAGSNTDMRRVKYCCQTNPDFCMAEGLGPVLWTHRARLKVLTCSLV